MNVFTYGSLMFPRVWGAVTGLPQPGERARLPEFVVLGLQGQVYPVIVPRPGVVAEGVLYRRVSPEALQKLDEFEGEFYRRCSTEVQTGDGSRYPAEVYVAADPAHPDITAAPWDPAGFTADVQTLFLRDYPGSPQSGRHAHNGT